MCDWRLYQCIRIRLNFILRIACEGSSEFDGDRLADGSEPSETTAKKGEVPARQDKEKPVRHGSVSSQMSDPLERKACRSERRKDAESQSSSHQRKLDGERWRKLLGARVCQVNRARRVTIRSGRCAGVNAKRMWRARAHRTIDHHLGSRAPTPKRGGPSPGPDLGRVQRSGHGLGGGRTNTRGDQGPDPCRHRSHHTSKEQHSSRHSSRQHGSSGRSLGNIRHKGTSKSAPELMGPRRSRHGKRRRSIGE